jgi:hypothetical protein
MRIAHSASLGFHVLELLGPDTDTQPVSDRFLADSPIEIDGYFAAFSNIQNNADTKNSVGLNRVPESLDSKDWELEPLQD